ncbi:hypothetical protein HZS_7467 [Henneguya salminicola]|nr:hypothetical protein HZS_7467 [Henneguya salminicola]
MRINKSIIPQEQISITVNFTNSSIEAKPYDQNFTTFMYEVKLNPETTCHILEHSHLANKELESFTLPLHID